MTTQGETMVPRWVAVFCAAGVSMYALACSSPDTPDTAAFWQSFARPEAQGTPPLSGELTVERLTEADAVVIVGTVLDVVPATLTDRAATDSGEISPEEYGRRYADAIVRVDETLHGRPVASEIRVGIPGEATAPLSELRDRAAVAGPAVWIVRLSQESPAKYRAGGIFIDSAGTIQSPMRPEVARLLKATEGISSTSELKREFRALD